MNKTLIVLHLMLLFSVNVLTSVAKSVEELEQDIEFLKHKLSNLEKQVEKTNTALRSQDQSFLEINQRFTGLDVDKPKAVLSVTAEYATQAGNSKTVGGIGSTQLLKFNNFHKGIYYFDENVSFESIFVSEIAHPTRWWLMQSTSDFQHGWGDGTLNFVNYGKGVYMSFDPNHNRVGIFNILPSYTLDVHGSVGAHSFNNTSDDKFKINKQKIDNSLLLINKLNGIKFDWNKEKFKDLNFPTGKQYGLIAQEVENVIPDLVNISKNAHKSINYIQIIPILIEAIKEQEHQITQQNYQIIELQKKLNVIKLR